MLQAIGANVLHANPSVARNQNNPAGVDFLYLIAELHAAGATLDEDELVGVWVAVSGDFVAWRHVFSDDDQMLGAAVIRADFQGKENAGPRAKFADFAIGGGED